MKIGIYTRLLTGERTVEFNQLKSGLKCMWLNGYDGYKLYAEYLEEESEDVSNRPVVNQMINDAEIGEISAIYVVDLSAFSLLSIKSIQIIAEFQKLNIPVYHEGGCFIPTDKNVQLCLDQIHEKWRVIKEQLDQFDFSDFDIEIDQP
jgi:DNA invertase Pin-like site-specific DNA recombinase